MFVKPLIVANWKMNCTLLESVRLMSEIRAYAEKNRLAAGCVVCPPFTLLRDTADMLPGTGIKLGAQNCFYEQTGSYTGEISPFMLRDMGCEYVILGHSERRMYFGETGETVMKKAMAAHKERLTAIICVGETEFERSAGGTRDAIAQQLEYSLPRKAERGSIIVAYEPVWAIGSGKIPSSEEIEDAHVFIKERVRGLLGEASFADVTVLYGGSVNAENAAEILALPNVDGVLAGRAGIDAKTFIEILRIADIEADNKVLVSG